MAHRNFRHPGLRQTTIARPDTLRTLRPFFPLRVDGTPDTNYRDFHLALHRLYGLSTDGAPHRLNAPHRLDIELSDNIFSIVSAAFKKAMEHIHKQGKYSPEMLSDKNVSELINATSSVLSEKLDDLSVKQEIPDDLAATLRKNIFYFSGFKTHHELEEASRLLQSDDGGFKSFDKFYEDVKAIDSTYNRNYLQAEYNFATASTQMAVKWKEWEQTADRYDLQYRTAGDDRVREEHRELDGITLPMTDPFWNEYYPPNGWNCRCNAVRVRKGKYPTSDSDEAIQKGKNCTATPKQQIFRFNPGKQEIIFPDKHPYFPKGCGNCDYKLSYDKDNPDCQACTSIARCISKFKTKDELSQINPDKDRSLFKKIRKATERSIKSDGKFFNKDKRLYSGRIYFGNSEKEAVMSHCYDGVEIKASEQLQKLLPTLRNGKYEPINMNRKNYKKKIESGVLHFTSYEIEIDGETFILKCEAIRNPSDNNFIYEHPYSLKRKKEPIKR